jgi:hypothetical protein
LLFSLETYARLGIKRPVTSLSMPFSYKTCSWLMPQY